MSRPIYLKLTYDQIGLLANIMETLKKEITDSDGWTYNSLQELRTLIKDTWVTAQSKLKTKPIIVRHLTLETKKKCTLPKLIAILVDIRHQGFSELCPGWGCAQCKTMFPRVIPPVKGKIKDAKCPCDVYETDYLIKRVQEIIKHFPEE